MIQTKRLTNCFFSPSQPRNVINLVFKKSSVLILSFFNHDFFKCVLPNKIFEYHAAAKPIIFAGIGDTADLIRKANSGITVPPEAPRDIADAVLYLAENPEKARSMGEAGKTYIMKNYSREDVFQKWNLVLSGL